MKKHWFRRKTYGYGWYPQGKEGWLIIAGAIVLIIIGTLIADKNLPLGTVIVFVTIIALIITCYKTGEKRNSTKYDDDEVEIDDWDFNDLKFLNFDNYDEFTIFLDDAEADYDNDKCEQICDIELEYDSGK
tara:strand:+ start:1902 stop:2294 length:393 start_codon:yes stop_codon:yes gene_type:complete